MLVPFLIMLREGIEAALIVGIIASFLRHTGRARLMPAVWAGVFLALGLSLFVGAGLQWMAAEFPQKQQELFEALVGFIAVGMLTGMVFWMRKASRSIKGELQASVDKALSTSGSASWALIGMVFLAVAREGVESVFFLLAIFQQSSGWSAAAGAFLSVALSVLLGVGLYKGGVRINLRQFFRYTGIFILVVAAGLLAGAVRRLHEAGVWNQLQQVVFDSSAVLPEDSPLGVILGGLLGYMHAPVAGEVLAWALYQAWQRSRQVPGTEGTAVRAAFMMVLMMALHSQLEYPLWYLYFLLPTAWAWGVCLGAGARPAATVSAPAAGAPAASTAWLLRAAGVAMMVVGLAAIQDYRRVVVIYAPPADATPLSQRIAEGQRAWLFGHQADYAAATTAEHPGAVMPAIQRAAHNLLDTRLMIAWAKAYDELGDVERARHLADRLREFRNPNSDEFFAECKDSTRLPRPFQCTPASRPMDWRDFR